MFLPTPPSEVVTTPGLVECLPREASGPRACAVMSTAAEPNITKSALALHLLVNCCDFAGLQVVMKTYRRGFESYCRLFVGGNILDGSGWLGY